MLTETLQIIEVSKSKIFDDIYLSNDDFQTNDVNLQIYLPKNYDNRLIPEIVTRYTKPPPTISFLKEAGN